ncbi:MAG: hypothetical protein ABII13_04025 [Patescibacteria group bacterium]|nr:hypothetical protein [Patescibacteria group bacterium]MBU2508906.1 hypothetical protein [Patescibacteria group bacterium]
MNINYAYLYDGFLSERKYEREVAALETKLNTYDLAGKISRLALFREPKDLVMGMVNKRISTIVVVGNDETLFKIIGLMPELNATIGYIPLAKPSAVADLLSIPIGSDACDVLAARFVETLDMGLIGDQYFFTEVFLPNTRAGLNVEGQYQVSPVSGGSLSIRNLGGIKNPKQNQADAKDGLLEAVVIPNEEKKRSLWRRRRADKQDTRIMFSNGSLVSDKPINFFVDNKLVSGQKIEVSILPGSVRFITGRGRVRKTEKVLPKPKKNATLASRE